MNVNWLKNVVARPLSLISMVYLILFKSLILFDLIRSILDKSLKKNIDMLIYLIKTLQRTIFFIGFGIHRMWRICSNYEEYKVLSERCDVMEKSSCHNELRLHKTAVLKVSGLRSSAPHVPVPLCDEFLDECHSRSVCTEPINSR